MARMDEDTLLAMLQRLEEDAASFASSTLGPDREAALKEYFREPYGTEEDGWSSVVTSDVQDTVEWILPDLLDIFTSTDEAVQFDPQQAQDVKGAQQATDTCNYIFYRRNNGFVTLYTAFKDALLAKNCAVMWRKCTERVKVVTPIRAATPEMLVMALEDAGEDAEIESAEPFEPPPVAKPAPPALPGGAPQGAMPGGPPAGANPAPPIGPNGARGFAPNMAPGGVQPVGGLPPQGPPPNGVPGGPPAMPAMPALPPGIPLMPPEPPPPMFNARISRYVNKTYIKVEAFNPDDLLVAKDWTTPLLDACPYVARNMEVTLSELQQMGFEDVDPKELAASSDASQMNDSQFRSRRRSDTNEDDWVSADDESQTRGWLRIEYVLVDFDGDGVAERREILRLKNVILSNEECAQVPIASATPCIVPHRWDGLSIAEMVSDIQQVKTELTRQMLNNAYLSNNPRKKVLTDVNWSPLANIDDLLDSRPGGVLRQRQLDAITVDQTPWIGGNMFPLLEYIDNMREQRTGVSKQQQGLDPNALRPDRTATEITMTATAARQRIRLIARILAETLMKPVFAGILKLLTEGGMEKIAFRLRGEFVEYDPNEWADHYDMTINVGLGTGDRQQQQAMLQQLLNNQMGIAQTPFGPLLIAPQQIYNTQAKLTENSGFKDVDNYWTNPHGKPIPQTPPPPDPSIQVAQIKAQSEMQMAQAQAQHDAQLAQMRAQQEGQMAQMDAQFKAQLEQMRIAGNVEGQKANLALQATNDQRDAEREALKAGYEQENAERDRELEVWKANLEAQTRLQIAQLQAQVQAKASEDRKEAMANRPKPMNGGGSGGGANA